MKFALGTRSPDNPNYFKSSLYTDPNSILLKVTKSKDPYYDPIQNKVRDPKKEMAEKEKKKSEKSKRVN